jgi:octaprenyl-diphosphate synthase
MALGPTDLSTAKERFAAALTLTPELAEVERIITAAFASDVRLMREIPAYLINLGGKRIRPVLALLTGKALGLTSPPPRLLDIAAGIELIHMATLLHDDIVDRSPIRRHKPSPLAKYGINATLLSGDFLLTRAFGLCARLDSTIINATEQACIELVEGEALETSLHEETHTLSTSLTIAKRKAAESARKIKNSLKEAKQISDSILKLLQLLLDHNFLPWPSKKAAYPTKVRMKLQIPLKLMRLLRIWLRILLS